MFYTEICAIAKDEHSTIEQWLRYHFSIGFEHATIFDNNSETPLKKLLAEFIAQNLVSVIDFPTNQSQQLTAYFSYLKDLNNQSHWTAFIDIDEYIVTKNTPDIRNFLEQYEDFSGVAAHWIIFGSNGLITRPNIPIFKAYQKYLRKSETIKTILKPKNTKRPISPHHFEYENEHFCVNEDGVPVFGPFSYHTSSYIQINHYYYQSQYDFIQKIERGFATKIANKSGYTLNEFFEQAYAALYEDNSILKASYKYDHFSDKPLSSLAQYAQSKAKMQITEHLNLILRNIKKKKFEKAVEAIKNAQRYYTDISLDLLHIFTCITTEKHKEALELIRIALVKHKDSEEAQRLIYKKLADYYRSVKRNNEALCIEDFIDS